MKNRKIWIASVLFLVFVCLVAGAPEAERLMTSFPEILLGQVYLTREAVPLSPRAYQSAELVLDEVDLTEIEQAFYIDVQEDVLFWEPTYTGFSRTELSTDEIHLLQEWLASGALFYQVPDGSAYQCIGRDPSGNPNLETCTRGEQYFYQFVETRWDAEQNRSVGVLQFLLSGHRLAEVRIFRSSSAVAYVPFEKAGDWWLQGMTVPIPLLDQLSRRVASSPRLILWPDQTAAQANARAARIIGNRYRMALDLINNSSAVREVFGEIREVRPAVGSNSYSSWMDSTSVTLTLWITGGHGEGAVLIRGYDCFHIQMVFEGHPVRDDFSSICP